MLRFLEKTSTRILCEFISSTSQKIQLKKTVAATKGFLQRFFKNFAIFKIKHLCRRIFLIKLEARWAILKTYYEQYVGTTASEKRNAT